MSKSETEDPSDPPYQAIRDRFIESFEGSSFAGPYRDDAFIADAIWVLCIEGFRDADDTPLSKATRAIAARLMGIPDLEKEWRVSFPYVWMSKDNVLTQGEKERRGVAFRVWQKTRIGTKVTHAIAEVAAELHFSPQKVTKDYYDWKDHHDRVADLASGQRRPSNSGEEKKE